ncbi:hypothetical protein [Halobacillus sp. K22]|uniref:hypothetical protein n=1 Tax=Halobacillus sp. K22 TaxID=3457431 RepID=UPI003FCDBE5B
MVYAYIVPLVILICFFIAVLLLAEWFATFFLCALVLVTFVLPYILLYQAEGDKIDEKN